MKKRCDVDEELLTRLEKKLAMPTKLKPIQIIELVANKFLDE